MSLLPAIYLLGIGGIGGFFVGYGAKKFTKILAIFTGVFSLAVISLNYVGVLAINYEGILGFISKLFDPTQAVEVLMPLIANLPLVLSFIVGLLIGLKKS